MRALRVRQVEALRLLRAHGGEWPNDAPKGTFPDAHAMDRVMRSLVRAGAAERTGWVESARGRWLGIYRLTEEGRTCDLPAEG